MIPLSIFYSNTLISMYSKFNDTRVAKYLFDEMPEKNEATWNTMISAHVRMDLYLDALKLFGEMRSDGLDPNAFVVASIVTACNRSENLMGTGFGIHSLVIKFGLLEDVFVGSALLHFYGTYGFVTEAQRFFDEMPHKNVVSWTSMMVAHSDTGQPEKVIDMYHQIRQAGIHCNENTLTTVISSCGILEDEFLGYQVLAQVIKSGFESNLSVANSLVSMFGNLGRLEEAGYVFNHMEERDTISWNSMITVYAHNRVCEKAFGCFNWMRHVHDEVNAATLSSLSLACDSRDNLKWGRGVHGSIVKLGLGSNVCVCNTLLTMYSGTGSWEDAEYLFREMPERDLISWNAMMSCYCQHNMCSDVVRLLAEVLEKRISVNQVIFASALAACASQEFLKTGKVIHALAISSGLQYNAIIDNSLITLYGKCGLMREAKMVFKMMPTPDTVTWNALIGAHAENEETDEALKCFMSMRRESIHVNYITLVNLLATFTSSSDLLKHGMPVHGHIICLGFELDEYVKNSLITMYAKCGDLDSSSIVFNSLANINYITYNAMMAANARHGRAEEALKLFSEMCNARIRLDQFSLSSAFAAAANIAALEEGQMIHGLAIKLGFDSNLYVTNAAMDMYGKCGELRYMRKILPQPHERSRLSWNILISAYARQGFAEKARETFDEMLNLGVKPDHVTFVSLLSACNHSGLVDEGLAYYSSMTEVHGVPPGIEHCVCMIDLLGRCGRLSEAENFINEMPVPPSGLIWRSLLASSRIYGNLELGKIAVERLVELGPSDDSAYVLYSNVCAATGRWDDVENVRCQMQISNIKKQPACSWVKLRNKVNTFGMGEQSHPQTVQINAKLQELKKMITEAGYVADTSYALQDTDEEQKELNLWNHSERLALAFALINTPQGSTVRVFKNLRVCGDCHSVYKLVSGVVPQEIILRDPYRFHHFSGGKCSCCDYW